VNASVQPLFRDTGAELGYTSESEPVILHHNSEMAAHGILPMISWWARDTYAGDRFLKFYLSIPGPQIGILYEAVGPGRFRVSGSGNLVRLAQEFGPPTGDFAQISHVSRHAVQEAAGGDDSIDFNDPENQRIFIDDMAHLQSEFFSKYPDRFYRIDGRPIVFIWITRPFTGPFDRVVERAREQSSFYLVGSEFTTPINIWQEHEPVVRAMDAISSYGFYDIARYGRAMSQRFINDYGAAINDWSAWLAKHSSHTKIIPPVQFSYDETRIPGRHGYVFDSTLEMARQHAEKARVLTLNPCGSGRVLDVAYITSYNEHYEGTSIEPSDVYGDSYLRLIRDTFAVPRTVLGDRSDCDKDRGPDRDR
jgi:hypothetical protein